MDKQELFNQAAKNAGFKGVSELVASTSKQSRIVEMMKDPFLNPHNSIEKTFLFSLLPVEMKEQISKMPNEDLKVACAAYLADDLPQVVNLLS
jgi:hypothetical protein